MCPERAVPGQTSCVKTGRSMHMSQELSWPWSMAPSCDRTWRSLGVEVSTDDVGSSSDEPQSLVCPGVVVGVPACVKALL